MTFPRVLARAGVAFGRQGKRGGTTNPVSFAAGLAYKSPCSKAGPDVTGLLVAWSSGDEGARSRLIDAVYAELRRLARGYLQRERQDHSLAPTALVHEAYLKLVDQRRVQWQNRSQFFAIAAHLMRRILVDHARVASRAETRLRREGAARRPRHRVRGVERRRRGAGRGAATAGEPPIRARASWWSCGSSAD